MSEKKLKEKNPDRLPVGKFFAWKTRDIALACVTVVMGFLTMFCTDYLGMPAALVGTLLLAGRVFDGVTDLVSGFLIDNTNTRFGKGRPYEWCIIGSWLATMLLFFCPPEWSITVKSIWVFIMYNLAFSIFNTLLLTAQTPYMIRAFGRRMVIAKVGSYGGIVTMIGSMAVSISFPMLMAKLAKEPGGWRNLIMIYALPLALLGILRFFFVKEDQSIDAGKTGQKIHLKEMFQMFKTNKYAWFYAGVNGLFQMIVGMNVATYYFKYIIGNIAAMGPFSVLGIAILPVSFLFPVLLKKMGLSKLIQITAVLAVIGYAINFFALNRIPFLIAGSICASVITLPLSYLVALIIMQLANYNEWKGLPRLEGTSTVVVQFVSKVMNGVGTGLLGILLGKAGYDGALQTQSESAVFMIRSLYTLIPLACMVGIIIFITAYSKLEKMSPQIEAELKDRRAATETVQA
ncbi:MAG: MFS transporter [Treponema sp.]|nr:MFS transporter [Treponema sp.]